MSLAEVPAIVGVVSVPEVFEMFDVTTAFVAGFNELVVVVSWSAVVGLVNEV